MTDKEKKLTELKERYRVLSEIDSMCRKGSKHKVAIHVDKEINLALKELLNFK